MLPVIHIGGLAISTWRSVVLISAIVCSILVLIRTQKMGYTFYQIFPALLFGLPVATIGGHLFNMIIPLITGVSGPFFTMAGLTEIGSIIFVIIYSFLYFRYILKVPVLPLLDAIAFILPLATLIGRIGCILAGCCYGNIAPKWIDMSFLSILTLRADSYVPSSAAWLSYQGIPGDLRVWNFPLLLMISASVVLVITEIVYRRRKKWHLYPGTVISGAGTLYTSGRFTAEFFRKEELIKHTFFNPWQLSILVMFFLFFIWLCFSIYKRSVSREACYS